MDFNRTDQNQIHNQPTQQQPPTMQPQQSQQLQPPASLQQSQPQTIQAQPVSVQSQMQAQAPIQTPLVPQSGPQSMPPNSQPPSLSQAPTSVATSAPTFQLPAGARLGVPSGQHGQRAEYLVLLPSINHPRQPGVPVRYPFIPIQRHQMMAPRATILQQPTLLRGVTQQGAMGVHSVIPTSQPLGFGVQTSMGPTQIIHQANLMNSSAIAPSQMTPGDALNKGISFFNSLLTKVSIKNKKTTLQNLIQALIDGKKTSEEFASALQKELNSGPQQQLVPFLELLLPHLRQSINSGQTKLPGIRPPNAAHNLVGSLPPPAPVMTQPSDDSNPSTSSPNKVQSSSSASAAAAAAKKKKTPLAPGQKSAWAIKKEAREAKRREREGLANQDSKIEDDKKEAAKSKQDKPKRLDKQKKQEKQLESLSSALRDDDDVNDVAAMGGVNLAEESQRIMASGAELVGTQIRSCKDEPFLDTKVLTSKISRIAKEYNLAEPSKDVVTIISHAAQERLKNIVERLGILAEHRSENLKMNPRYEPTTDIKGQMKFLAELDRIEKRRYEEQERELLLKVAKSRSKVEDPEQQKLRQKAKDMQRAEQEEVRQREANETALLALGPRKKLKTSTTSSISSSMQLGGLKDVKTSSLDVRGDAVRRMKRVSMRDLQVLLELDRAQLNRLVKITS